MREFAPALVSENECAARPLDSGSRSRSQRFATRRLRCYLGPSFRTSLRMASSSAMDRRFIESPVM
jgi:hypothetical protein